MNSEMENEENTKVEKVEKKSILYNRKWNKEEAAVIRKVVDFLGSEDESKTNSDLNKLFENRADKELIRKLFQENRNELLMEILRPFETGNDGINTTHLKLDLLKETNDERFTMKNIEGYIYDYIQKDDQVEIQFRITNDRMRKFDKLFLLSNFKYNGTNNKYIHIPKWNAEKPFDLDNDKANTIDFIYYPYEYYFDIDVSKEEARQILKKGENTEQLYVDKENNYYRFNIRDLGLPLKNNTDQKEQESNSSKSFEESIESLKKAVESRDIDEIKKCLKETNVSVEKIVLQDTENRLNCRTDKDTVLGCAGRMEFVDDSSSHNAFLNAYKNNSTMELAEIDSGTSTETQLADLFDYYLKADIDIYKVSLGNCVVMNISYKKKGKKNNLLIFDAGVNTSNYFKEECIKVNNCTPETIIEKTAETLKKRIEDFHNEKDKNGDNKNGEVYFMVSHYHPDHINIIDELLFRIRLIDEDCKPLNCIMNSPNGNDEYSFRQCIYLFSFVGGTNCSIAENDVLYSKGGIKVLKGKANPQLSAFEQENQHSLMIQLKNTLLPADSYYRYWHDEFGKIYRLNDKNESELNYKKFKHLFAPHHGWINVPGIDNEAAKIKEAKTVIEGIYENKANNDKDNTDVYVLRHDEGSGNSPITSDLMKSLGIDTDKHYFITEYKSGDKYSFTDQWDFTTMSDEEIVDECIWALINTPKVGDNKKAYINSLHQYCSRGYTIPNIIVIMNESYCNPYILDFGYDINGFENDISNYFGKVSYYNISYDSIKKEFVATDNDLEISEVE